MENYEFEKHNFAVCGNKAASMFGHLKRIDENGILKQCLVWLPTS